MSYKCKPYVVTKLYTRVPKCLTIRKCDKIWFCVNIIFGNFMSFEIFRDPLGQVYVYKQWKVSKR